MNQIDPTSTIFGRKLSNRVLLGIILLITLICLFPTLQNDWVNWDDDSYVLRNPLVHSLSFESISNIFLTSNSVGHYHPITLISLAIDYHFWGTNAFGFHLTSFFFHLINTYLVFILIKKIKAPLFVAFLGSLLFGMHPMHVESVAWISGRKDVLYTFFFLLSIITYLRYLHQNERKKVLWYSLAIFFFICSILTKSLGFVLPLILLLFDYLNKREFNRILIIDKIPFAIIGVFGAWLAVFGQQESDTMLGMSEFPIQKTLFIGSENAFIYAVKSLVPIRLSIFHPFQFSQDFQLSLLTYLSAIPAIAVLFILYRSFKRSRALFFGLSFYLITIGPVLQIFPNGKAIMSERYTYIPYIGIFYLIALGLHYLLKKTRENSPKINVGITVLSLLWFVFLGAQTYTQSKVWQNSETLWTQPIERYPDNYWAYLGRGTYWVDNNNLDGALKDLDKSIALSPSSEAHYERGRLYEKLGNLTQAAEDYANSIQLNPNYAKPYLNQGILFARGGDMEKATTNFNKAIELDDNYALAHFNLGMAYKQKGENKSALNAFTKAIQLEPNNALFLRNRGVLNNALKNYNAAIADFERAMPLEPNSGEPYLLRSMSYFYQGKIEEALQDAKTASTMGVKLPEEYLENLRSAD